MNLTPISNIDGLLSSLASQYSSDSQCGKIARGGLPWVIVGDLWG